jgi:hypothetical protein
MGFTEEIDTSRGGIEMSKVCTSRMILYGDDSPQLKDFVRGLGELGLISILLDTPDKVVVEFEGTKAFDIFYSMDFNIVVAPKWQE